MFKKTAKSLSLIFVLSLVISMIVQPSYAATYAETSIEPRWTNASSVVLSIDSDATGVIAKVTIVGRSGATYNNGKVVLEKLSGSCYQEVESWTGLTGNSYIFKFQDTYSTNPSGTYRLSITINTVRNGVTETITGSTERTY